MSENWPYAKSHLFIDTAEFPELPDGYLVAQFSSAQRSIAELWAEDSGVFLFLRARASGLDIPALESKLRVFLLDPLNREVRFAWIENPSDALADWRSHSLSVASLPPGSERKISQPSRIDLRNYSLFVGAGTRIAPNNTNTGFVLTRDPADAAHGAGFELSTGHGAHRFRTIGDPITLPMRGASAGCLQFDFHVDKSGAQDQTFGYPALADLDIGFRMFFRDPDAPQSGARYDLASHRYPLVQEQSQDDHGYSLYPQTIGFRVSLDPLHPLVAARSYLVFQPISGSLASTGIPSAYRTNRGYTVHLIPVGDQSRLQFALRPTLLDPAARATAPLYLVPAGDYGLQVPNYETGKLEPTASIVCGISGVEYLKITHDTSTRLSFVPGQPAFAHAFMSVASLLRDLPSILESHATTTLPPDTVDLDIPIEDTGRNDGALGITDQGREDILDIVRRDYFPPGYQFGAAQVEAYSNLEFVEELISWLQKALQAATFDTRADANAAALSTYPDTSWAYLRENAGVVYHAQPDQAVLYKADSSDTDFLDYMEVPSVGLPAALSSAQSSALASATGVAAQAFPMLPYGAVDPARLSDIRQLEISLINNYRRNRIHHIGAVTNFSTSLMTGGAGDGSKPVGTTPQGLIASFSPDYTTIETLQLARDTKNQLICLAKIGKASPLKAALQSNQLFMIVTDPEAIRPYFDDAVLATIGATNRMDIQNWGFELGPNYWKTRGTILIFKFHDKPLIELAKDPSLWSLADELNEDKQKASRNLLRLLEAAVEAVASGDPKAQRKYAVLDRAARQANWSGVLVLNVHVPLGNVPDALKALAAGIDPDLFYAHHVGVEVTQVSSDGKSLISQQSSLFGLIDYQNPNIPLSDPSGYNFHVPELTVVFQNSLISDFAAEILLVLDRLFDEATHLYGTFDGRNLLRLKGVAEEHDGKVTYSFGFSGDNHFMLSGKVVQEVEIVKAQFATDPLTKPEPEPLPVKGRFVLWGRIRFAYHEKFDILSFGRTPNALVSSPLVPGEDPPPPDYLSSSNLQIVMSFNLDQKNNRVEDLGFAFNPYQMAFDLDRSGARSHSLYEKFPLKFSGLRYVDNDANALSKSGFMPVSTPLAKVELGSKWYGITYELNLGSAGALAGSAGIVVSILIAWVPEQDGLYIGLELPGSSGGKKEISIQGLLKITFKSIQFVVYPLRADAPDAHTSEGEREVGYLLKIKNIELKFFMLSFPPSGATEFILFGDPREIDRKDKLVGWYAAYAK